VCAADASSEPAAPWPADALEVGRVADAWGVKGWIKVQPFSSDPQALLAARQWFVKPPEPRAGIGGPGRPSESQTFPPALSIVDVRRHGDFVVALPRGGVDRNSAEALRGARLFVSRSSFPVSGDDEYYWTDLIGLQVRNRGGKILGRVVGLIETGPQSVLRIQSAEADSATDERLIPFVAAYIDEVDVERRCITVDWGLDF